MSFVLSKKSSADEMLQERSFLAGFWREVLLKAKALSASDIHIESLKSGLQIRYRVNGSLIKETEKIVQTASIQLVDKFKEISGLDLSSKSKLQDASFSAELTDSTYRVCLSPGFQYGECLVTRIIDNSKVPQLSKLSLSKKAYGDISWAIKEKQGLILVTGPTGSGKSTTLQACIAALDSGSKKIIAIENPPERLLEGVVHEKITESFDWADSIKAAMRQDPDVILVGEVRDARSAKLAIEASQTGHLVLSTLHANNVSQTVSRLLTLGIEKHLIADNLLLVSAQRLLKTLCRCKVPYKDMRIKSDTGCSACDFLGYSGRTLILEYCLRPKAELIYEFSEKNFSKHLSQSLELETKKLVELGVIDARIVQPVGELR